jgi:hypothetical protein
MKSSCFPGFAFDRRREDNGVQPKRFSLLFGFQEGKDIRSNKAIIDFLENDLSRFWCLFNFPFFS